MNHDYNCELVKVIDGDTVDVLIDLGFHTWRQERIQIWGVNAPELRRGTEEERELGKKAKEFVVNWFKRHKGNICVTTGMSKTQADIDKYGRWIGDFYSQDPISRRIRKLSDELVEAELAEPHLEKNYYWGQPKEKRNLEEYAPLDTPDDT